MTTPIPNDRDRARETYIRKQILKQVTELIPLGVLTGITLATLLMFAMLYQVPFRHSVIWFGMVVLVSLSRLPAVFFFLKQHLPLSFLSQRHYLLFGISLTGALWGGSSYVIFAESSTLHQALHIVALGGLVSGAIAIYAIDVTMFLAFCIPTLLPMIWRLFSMGETYDLIGMCLSLFLAYSILSTRRINKNLIYSFNLRFERRLLVEKLKTKQETELRINRRLEEEIRDHKAVTLELSTYKLELEELVLTRTKALNAEIKERQAYEKKLIKNKEKLAFLDFHDGLTKLPNRLFLKETLSQATQRADRAGKRLALLFLDLDNFKDINDTLGHDTGDALLQHVATLLKSYCRTDDTIARLGGDEFMFLLENLSNGPNELRIICERITQGLNEAIMVAGHEIKISASMGITIYPDDGADIETLIKNSDLAMYRAKELGKNKFCFFTDQMNIDLRRKVQLEHDLQEALDNNELILYYQAKVNIQTYTITGCEALIRWRKADGTLIAPNEFIPMAELTGMIRKIDRLVLESAMVSNQRWNRNRDNRLNMAINISANQFQEANFPDLVEELLRKTGQDAGDITLEITENIVMEDVERAMETMEALSQLGVKIAIDDFGTGYSSLSYLKKFPVHILKIDQSFVTDIPHDQDDTMITTSILHLASNLGLSVVAEGVENTDQLEFLQQLGCEEVQGFLFCKPLPAHEFEAFLKENSAVKELVAH
jgi:diguanylate cyclase (GGDEF)-like protein